jgi:imidazolonepropionase-like amidohydrolase
MLQVKNPESSPSYTAGLARAMVRRGLTPADALRGVRRWRADAMARGHSRACISNGPCEKCFALVGGYPKDRQ